jgi:obg-like ATPase 1
VSFMAVRTFPFSRMNEYLLTLPDFEKTFIQCIVYNFDVLKELGDEAAVKAAGKVLTKGKDYEVADGDIILIKAGAAKS